ncbi:hypothetical protein HK100_001389, partial [Physocladia obscura]
MPQLLEIIVKSREQVEKLNGKKVTINKKKFTMYAKYFKRNNEYELRMFCQKFEGNHVVETCPVVEAGEVDAWKWFIGLDSGGFTQNDLKTVTAHIKKMEGEW